MQATLDVTSLKHFTRALACLSKYGDDLTIHATPDALSLSATNSSLSAYARFKYGKQFFTRYHLNGDPLADDVQEVSRATGQLLTKSLLSILKHRTIEKTVDKCELSIVDGSAADNNAGEPDDEDRDGLESKLIVRLHCKHGVTKTHRLLLMSVTTVMTPSIPDALNESRLTIGPKNVRDMIDHFPISKGPKSDPQLIWNFGYGELQVRSMGSAIEAKGTPQLTTELTIGEDEFDVFDIHSPPITIAFHLREFMATIAFAEASGLALDLRFTDPAAPLFIDLEGDLADTLFVISTSQVHGVASNSSSNSTPNNNHPSNHNLQSKGKKREIEHEHDSNSSGSRQGSVVPRKKPMKAVVRTDPREQSVVGDGKGGSARTTPHPASLPPPPSMPSMPAPPSIHSNSMAPPPSAPPPAAWGSIPQAFPAHSQARPAVPLFFPSSQPLPSQAAHPSASMPPPPTPPAPARAPAARSREPLFLPSSQLSQAASDAIRESGLGIEEMDFGEFEAMLEGDGEEVDFSQASQRAAVDRVSWDVDVEMADAVADAKSGERRVGVANVPARALPSSFEIFDEETQLGPTQNGGSSSTFKPLFDD